MNIAARGHRTSYSLARVASHRERGQPIVFDIGVLGTETYGPAVYMVGLARSWKQAFPDDRVVVRSYAPPSMLPALGEVELVRPKLPSQLRKLVGSYARPGAVIGPRRRRWTPWARHAPSSATTFVIASNPTSSR